MRLSAPKGRSIVVALIAGTLLAGSGLIATAAQAARLGNVSFSAPESSYIPGQNPAAKPPPIANKMARDKCNQNFPGKVRAVTQVQRNYLFSTTIGPNGPTLTFYQYTYDCLS